MDLSDVLISRRLSMFTCLPHVVYSACEIVFTGCVAHLEGIHVINSLAHLQKPCFTCRLGNISH